MAACLKIAHTGVADASFLKTLTTVPFSLHVGDLFLLHLHATQANSVLFQCLPLIGVQIYCAVIEAFTPHPIADESCLVNLIFSDFLCGGLTIFDFFRNGGLSDLLKLAGSRSSSSSLLCSSREESEKLSFRNEISAALDTKFNGLCVSAKTGFKLDLN